MDILKEINIKQEESKPINVSISVGITEMYKDDDYISIVKRVDMALLEAKKQGKSKIVIDNILSDASEEEKLNILKI